MNDTYGNSLRACGGCSAFILCVDEVTPTVWCPKCLAKKTPFNRWAAGLKAGDYVFLQPGCTRSPLYARSRHVIIERDADMLIVQPIGCPDGRVSVHVGNTAEHDVVPWTSRSLY